MQIIMQQYFRSIAPGALRMLVHVKFDHGALMAKRGQLQKYEYMKMCLWST